MAPRLLRLLRAKRNQELRYKEAEAAMEEGLKKKPKKKVLVKPLPVVVEQVVSVSLWESSPCQPTKELRAPLPH